MSDDIPPELQFPRRAPWQFDEIDLINLAISIGWQRAGMTIPDDPFDRGEWGQP